MNKETELVEWFGDFFKKQKINITQNQWVVIKDRIEKMNSLDSTYNTFIDNSLSQFPLFTKENFNIS